MVIMMMTTTMPMKMTTMDDKVLHLIGLAKSLELLIQQECKVVEALACDAMKTKVGPMM